MHVRLKTGEWRHIPGRLTEADDGYLWPVDRFVDIAPHIVSEDLLKFARKLVKTAAKRQWQVRYMHINRMQLELAMSCINQSMADGERYYY
ncbi:hypothetical protein NDN16_15170 [Aureimonas altamirensis]|nr:hypothetical protein [Aureimonas altamirensis]